MSNLNRVVITGRLTQDPTLRAIPSGTNICEFGLAVNGRQKKGQEWVDRVDFFDVVVWGKQGENVAQYMNRGKPVAVDGRLRQDRWEKDGQTRSKVIIVADSVQFLSDGQDRDRGVPAGDRPGSGYGGDERPGAGYGQDSTGDDDIPF